MILECGRDWFDYARGLEGNLDGPNDKGHRVFVDGSRDSVAGSDDRHKPLPAASSHIRRVHRERQYRELCFGIERGKDVR